MSVAGYTANFRFKLVAYNSPTWHEDAYFNWRMVDAILKSNASSVPFAVATGGPNSLAVSYSPVPVLTLGKELSFQAPAANTGAMTLAVNGGAARAILQNGIPLTGGEITTGTYVKVVYNGTAWMLVTPDRTANGIADKTIGPAKLSTGAPTWDTDGNLSTPFGGSLTAPKITEAGFGRVLAHQNIGYASGHIFTSYDNVDNAQGEDGDFWIKLTP